MSLCAEPAELFSGKGAARFCEVDIMLFELKSVFVTEGETKGLEYELDMSQIDVDGVFPFNLPVRVKADASNRAGLVTLRLDCGFEYSRECDRCGEEVRRDMDMSFEHRLVQSLSGDAADDYIETPDFTLELDEVVISDILLTLPLKTLCKEDCRGLCPQCGANLNLGECGCDRRTVDPRLEILKQFMDE